MIRDKAALLTKRSSIELVDLGDGHSSVHQTTHPCLIIVPFKNSSESSQRYVRLDIAESISDLLAMSGGTYYYYKSQVYYANEYSVICVPLSRGMYYRAYTDIPDGAMGMLKIEESRLI